MTTLYGIKNCDTVRKACKWLDNNNIDYRFHDFRVDGINEPMITEWLDTVALDKLINKRSTSWKQLTETQRESLSLENAPALCVQYETLVKRPVLIHNNDIHLGFSDKSYQAIFA